MTRAISAINSYVIVTCHRRSIVANTDGLDPALPRVPELDEKNA